MLKIKALLTLMMVALCTVAFAQTISITEGTAMSADVTDGQNTDVTFHIPVTESVTLNWEVLSDNMPDAWSVTTCDAGNCFPGLPTSGSMSATTASEGFIKLTINPNGELSTATVEFKITNAADANDTKSITLTITGTAAVASINSVNHTDIKLFPNPATSVLQIDATQLTSDVEASVTDATGKVVIRKTLNTLNNSIDVAELRNGIYFITFKNENDEVFRSKFIKK